MDSLTVIIPTFNRRVVLSRALEGYCAQSEPDAIHELIVVDDGSTDDTEAAVNGIGERSPFPIRYLRQANSGPAAARNLGIKEARTEVILFTDSDIIPDADLVAQHLEWHNNYPEPNVAVLGYVTWPSQPAPTGFMRWYGENQLFAYGQIRNQTPLDFRMFYSCNLSLKAEFLRMHGQFDESFTTAAYEDLELGYRLGKAGLRLVFNRKAIGYHHQFFLFDDACKKSRANAGASRIFTEKEAGRYLLELQSRRRLRLGHRLAKWAAVGAAAMLTPAKRFLDSDTSLPSYVYDLLFWQCRRTRPDH